MVLQTCREDAPENSKRPNSHRIYTVERILSSSFAATLLGNSSKKNTVYFLSIVSKVNFFSSIHFMISNFNRT